MTRSTITLIPALVCFVYFCGGVPFYWLHQRRVGVAREPRIERRRRSVLIPKFLIYYLLWMVAPVERAMVRRRISPNALTTIGFALGLAAACALAAGWFDVGGWLYLFVGIVDLFDGRVARATGRQSSAGAFWDSVLDRYSECAVFAGLFVYYWSSWVASFVLLSLIGSTMVSYVRSRAEAFGQAGLAERGAMQRPERIFLLGVALAASPFVAARSEHAAHPLYVVAVAVVVLLALASNFTALSRTIAVFRSLEHDGAAPPATRPAPPTTTRAELSSSRS